MLSAFHQSIIGTGHNFCIRERKRERKKERKKERKQERNKERNKERKKERKKERRKERKAKNNNCRFMLWRNEDIRQRNFGNANLVDLCCGR